MTLPLRDLSPGDRPEPTPVPSPAGRRPGGVRALALATASFLAAGLLGVVVVGGGTAEAGTVGAGSYTETRPPGTALPKGCGDISTNPRHFVTADAPPGAIPTNDWWSSLLWKRINCAYSENTARPPAVVPRGATTGSDCPYTTTPAISGTATGVGEYHYPYTEDIRVGVAGLGAPVVKVDDWTDWTVTPYWSDGARTMRATIGHGLPFSYFQVTGGNAQITAAAHARPSGRNTGAHDRLHRQRPRLRRRTRRPARPGRWPARRISSTLAGKGYFSVAVLPGRRRPAAPPWPPLRQVRPRARHRHRRCPTRTTRRPAR